jgi:outer membrane lipoprotein-sorting protein
MKYTNNIESTIKRFCLRRKSAAKTSAELDERIVDDALQAQRESKTTKSAATRPYIWRIIMRARMTKYITAAVIALVIIMGIIEVGKPVAGANAVFAAAMDSVRQARTFSCIRISEMQYQDGEKDGMYLLKQRRMFKEPDWERREQLTSAPPWPQHVGEVVVWHYGKRQRLELRPFDKTARFHDMSSDYVIDEKTGEVKLSQLDTRTRDYLLRLSAEAIEDLGNVDLDGQSVRMLRSRKGKRITTVWVNPKTSYPVQIESTWADRSRPPLVFASIQIDTDLNDDMFSLEPPEGYTLSVHESRWPDDKSKMMTKMKYLGLWCVMYANENDGRFPGGLADLVTWGVTTDKVLNTLIAAPDDPDGPPVIRYRKPKTDAKARFGEVILYEIYDRWPEDGVVAGFADGHCQLIVDQKRFEELIK